jgi:hypothetical protein
MFDTREMIIYVGHQYTNNLNVTVTSIDSVFGTTEI